MPFNSSVSDVEVFLTDLQNHEEFVLGFNHLVEFADILVHQNFHCFNLHSNSWNFVSKKVLVHDLYGNFLAS